MFARLIQKATFRGAAATPKSVRDFRRKRRGLLPRYASRRVRLLGVPALGHNREWYPRSQHRRRPARTSNVGRLPGATLALAAWRIFWRRESSCNLAAAERPPARHSWD